METGPTDVWTLDFSPDGKHIISGSNAGKILIFEVESGKQEQTLDTRGKFTLSVAYVSYFTYLSVKKKHIGHNKTSLLYIDIVTENYCCN